MARNDIIDIRIAPDGRLFIDGCTEEMLEMAADICRHDPAIRRRLEALRRARSTRPSAGPKETLHGDASTDK